MDFDWPLVGRTLELEQISAALDDPTIGGAVLIGPGGVGKTRLATSTIALAESRGYATARVVATQSAQGIALGALAPLLPDLGERNISLLSAARSALAQRAAGLPLLVFVDDAHLLDDTSAALLLQLVTEPSNVFILATVRSGEVVGDAITSMWKDGRARRIDIDALTDLDMDWLIVKSFEGGVDPVARAELLRISDGNPMALRELTLGAIESGSLRASSGLWRLEGPVTVSARLSDLVAGRVDGLDPDEYEALEVLALGEPLELGIFEGLVDSRAIEGLERRGVLTVREDDGRLEAWLEHPLHGEIVRDRMGLVRSRNLARALADAVEASSSTRHGDVLRIATWRLESGTDAGEEVYLAAARHAYVVLDVEMARRFSQAAWDRQRSYPAGAVLGHALCDLGRFDEAELILAVTADLAVDEEQRVFVAMARSESLFRAGRFDEARRVCEEAERESDDDVLRLELQGHRATFVMLMGEGAQAMELVEAGLRSDAPRPRIQAAIAAATSYTYDGRPDDAFDVATSAYAVHEAIWDQQLFQSEPGIHVITMISALANAGRLDEAEVFATEGWRVSLEGNMVPALAWFALFRGNVSAARGAMVDALGWYERAATYFESTSQGGRRRWALAGAVLAAASCGRVEEAQAFERQADGIEVRFLLMGEVETDASAWLLSAAGQLGAARDLLDAATDTAIANRRRTSASVTLHSLARLGAPERAVERMVQVADGAQGILIAARAAHVVALVDGSGDALEAVARSFEAMGCWLYAAEADADAARAWQARNATREATAAITRSRSIIAAHCPEVRTPALVFGDEPTPLTRRERDVALLAAQGMSSKLIAERLFVSVRTVENHLQRCYEKLGVRGRDELATALAT